MGGDSGLPEGWTKHYSKTWQKDYWFNAKTGEQKWEPPAGAAPAAGAKRSAEEAMGGGGGQGGGGDGVSKAPKVAAAPLSKPQAPETSTAVKKAAPAKGGGGGGALGSLLGSIAAEAASVDPVKLAEQRRKRKEAEDAKKAEEREKKENYRRFVQSTLDNFMMDDDVDYYEFQPTDNLHRLIVQDEAESRTLPVLSQGVEGESRCAIVFKPGKGPNELEQNYLQFDGTVAEMIRRRAAGDTFEKYRTNFSMKDAKIVQKTRVSKQQRDTEGDEEDIDARVVQDRAMDSGAAAEIAAKLRESKKCAIMFQKEVKDFLDD